MRSADSHTAPSGVSRLGLPNLGYGVGLRKQHFDEMLARRPEVDFLELLVENYMDYGGRPRDVVRELARSFPIVLHGVALSIGSVDPLDEDYLRLYAQFCEDTDALWASDHLCFSSAHGTEFHDLIPVPFTEEALDHVVARVQEVKRRLPVPFALENPSYYIQYPGAEMSEATFLSRLLEHADCGLLLDVNNVYVNATNHGYDAREFIDALPLHRVVQLHMAGHWDRGDVIIDTHGAAVIDPVLELFQYVISKTGPVATLYEWDHAIPPLDELVAENQRIRAAGFQVTGEVTPDALGRYGATS